MQIGAIIERGPMDWQILQQIDGNADIDLSGRWEYAEPSPRAAVFARVVREDTGETVIPWTLCEELAARRWRVSMKDVPAGGLYRVETCLNRNALEPNACWVLEWSVRGDMIHHVGVGDLYVIAGQSNAAGYGKDPVYDPPEPGVHLLRNNGRWDMASHPLNESTNTAHEENRELANPGHSPYLSFAKLLKKELGHPIGLIQTSLGGTNLVSWNPGEDGYLYRNMLNIIRSQGGPVKGVLWNQGTGCREEDGGTYLARFANMVDCLRKDLADERLPVLTVQFNRYVAPSDEATDRRCGIIREAQRQAALTIPHVTVAPSIDCGLSDVIHFSASYNIVMGERLARIALKYLYGRNLRCDAPDLAEARKIAPNRVKLIFRNVYDRLYLYEAAGSAVPLAVEDEGGFLVIEGCELTGPNELMLSLDRAIWGRCRAHGLYEQDPKGQPPIDFETHLPMLSFYGVEVMDN